MNQNKHSIFEYEFLNWIKFKSLDKVKTTLEQLDKQNKFNPFTYTANGIKARQYVGVISLAGECIQVLPKIFDKNGDIKLNIRGLMYLFKLTNKLDIKETDLANLSKLDDLLEVFIYLFANNLLELLHNDFQRNYVNKQDNLNYVKGKINFTQNIRYNLVNKSKIFCEYDEFEENILLNQILKATVNKCIKVSKNNFNLLQRCDMLLTNVADVKFDNPNICNQVKFNRLNQSYKYVFELAKLLLFGNSPSIANDKLQTFSIMFDMNKLFEEAVYQIINVNKAALNLLKVQAQKSSEYIFNKLNDKPSKLFNLQCDIYIEKNSDEKIIIDTKYKKIDEIKPKDDNSKYGVSQSDIYQIFAYNQYYKAKSCILLYPMYNNELNNTLRHDEQEFNLSIATLDLKIKENKKYSDYVNELKKQLTRIL